MSNKHLPPAGWRPLAFASALLLCIAYTASGQIPNLTPAQRPDTSPNPPAESKRSASRRTGNGARTAPSKLAQAIADGNAARDRNEYEQALGFYKKAQGLSPREARVFYGMGNVYADLYCYDSAVAEYRKALDLKKDYVEALVGMGYAYIGKESYDEAQKRFQAAHNIKPNNVDANIALGVVYAKKGEYQKAIEQINLVINDKLTTDKDRAKAYVTLGDVYLIQRIATHQEWQEIIRQYEKAKSIDPSLARAYLNLGVVKLSSAFEKFTSINMLEVTVQDRGQLAAAAKEATNYIEEAVNEHGYSSPDAYLLLGVGLMDQARYQEAVSKINIYIDKVGALEKQLSSADTNIAAKCGYGFSQLVANGYWYRGFVRLEESFPETDGARKAALLDEAGDDFKQAIKLKEDYALAYTELGIIYSQQGKYDQAIEQYNKSLLYTKDESGKALLHNSIEVEYIRKARDEDSRGKREDAIEDYTKAIPYAKSEPDKAALYESIGLEHALLGRVDDAFSNVQEAIKRDPKNPSFYVSLAMIYVSQDDIENTFKWLKKADEFRTTSAMNPDPYFFLGGTYAIRFLEQGDENDFKEAVRWLKRTVEIKRNYTIAYHALGKVYQSHSNPDEALASYEKAVQYDPKNPTAYMILGQAYLDLKHNDEAAIQYLKRAIELKQDYAEAHWHLGLAHHHKKDDSEATREILEAIKYDAKDPQAYIALASVYKDQKKYDEAIQYLSKATGIAPKDFRPYKELAKLYEEQKRNDDAIRAYEDALSLLDAKDPKYAWPRNLYLGRIERMRGRYAEAIAYFQKMPPPPTELPGQAIYEIGLAYVASDNKKAALEQQQQLVLMKSPLADELRNKINEMK